MHESTAKEIANLVLDDLESMGREFLPGTREAFVELCVKNKDLSGCAAIDEQEDFLTERELRPPGRPLWQTRPSTPH